MSDHGSVQYVSQYLQLHGFRESSELPGGGYCIWMALGKCFTADHYLVRMWQLYILFSLLSSEGW